METKTITSKQFTLQARDWVKGALMAALTPALVIIQQSIDAGIWTFNWKVIGMSAAAGFMAYLMKNFLEPSKVVEVKKLEP